MRAVVTQDYGSLPTLMEVDTPEAGPGEVRVRVRASSMNGFDMGLVRGMFKGMLEHRFPVIVGKDFAGTVDQVGPEVTEFAEGQDVFGVVMNHNPLGDGAFAQYVVVPASGSIAAMPPDLDYRTAGVIGLAGAAAVGVLTAVSPAPGEIVLVAGATGGVGAFALQLGARTGATIAATAADDEQAVHVRGLGAAAVVNYSEDLAAQVRAIAPAGVDVALHLAGDPFALADLVADGGRFASLLGIGAEQLDGRKLTAFSIFASPDRHLLETLASQVATGELRIPISRVYSLDEVPAAFADFAAGTLGKLAVVID